MQQISWWRWALAGVFATFTMDVLGTLTRLTGLALAATLAQRSTA